MELVRQVMTQAAEAYKSKDGRTFTAASFAQALKELSGVDQTLDGEMVEAILRGRPDVMLAGPSSGYYSFHPSSGYYSFHKEKDLHLLQMRVIGLLYTVLRDDLTCGRMEALVRDIEKHPGPYSYSNAHLFSYARDLVERIQNATPVEGHSPRSSNSVEAEALRAAAEEYECEEDHDATGATCPKRWLHDRADLLENSLQAEQNQVQLKDAARFEQERDAALDRAVFAETFSEELRVERDAALRERDAINSSLTERILRARTTEADLKDCTARCEVLEQMLAARSAEVDAATARASAAEKERDEKSKALDGSVQEARAWADTVDVIANVLALTPGERTPTGVVETVAKLREANIAAEERGQETGMRWGLDYWYGITEDARTNADRAHNAVRICEERRRLLRIEKAATATDKVSKQTT